MQKTASESWGVQPSELASFDPVVGMILGACSVEMEKVYNEVELSKGRTLERLSKLLMPDIYKGPLPAHGVLHAKPSEKQAVLNKLTQFYYNKKISVKESSTRDSYKDVYFTPVDDSLIYRSDIKYLAYNSGLHEMMQVIGRDPIATAQGNKKLSPNELWVGLEVNEELKNLNGLSFYFDWVGIADSRLMLSYLPFCTWQIGDAPLKFKMGRDGYESPSDYIGDTFEFDYDKIVFKNVSSFYADQFVTLPLLDLSDHHLRTAVPEVFSQVFGAKALEKVEKVVWIKISFPSFLVHTEFDNLNIAVNCFPVINRALKDLNYKIQDTFNIAPLNVPENSFFFSIQSVKSAEGKEFASSSLRDLNKMVAGSYVVRKGGVDRFDSRTATEYLSNIVDLLRDESASFAIYGQEMIADNLRALNQNLNQINQRIERANTNKGEVISYLVLKPENFNDTIFIEFWTTTGAFGNDIVLGSVLSPYASSDVNGDSLILMTKTQGGRDTLGEGELIENFKQSLISRDRIVTEADIQYFCMKEMRDIVKRVQIEKGLKLDSDAKSGFIKTIDVWLTVIDKQKYTPDEWGFVCDDLKTKLFAKMSTFLPIRVAIKD